MPYVGCQVDQAVKDRVQRVCEQYQQNQRGIKTNCTLSDILREALARGLSSLEDEIESTAIVEVS